MEWHWNPDPTEPLDSEHKRTGTHFHTSRHHGRPPDLPRQSSHLPHSWRKKKMRTSLKHFYKKWLPCWEIPWFTKFEKRLKGSSYSMFCQPMIPWIPSLGFMQISATRPSVSGKTDRKNELMNEWMNVLSLRDRIIWVYYVLQEKHKSKQGHLSHA